LLEKGVTDSRTGKERYWRGIGLRTETDNDVSSDKTSGGLASEVTRVTENSRKSYTREKQKKFPEKPVTPVTDVTRKDMTLVDPEWRAKALQVWEMEGKPVIHLGPGKNCFDLALLLSHGSVRSKHLAAVSTWLDSALRKGNS
jgi:hypothetical protein